MTPCELSNVLVYTYNHGGDVLNEHAAAKHTTYVQPLVLRIAQAELQGWLRAKTDMGRSLVPRLADQTNQYTLSSSYFHKLPMI